MSLELETCRLSIDGQVATVTIIPPRNLEGGTADLHWELGEVFSQLRGDTTTRVVVLTGEDGELYQPMSGEFYDTPELRGYVADPEHSWKTFTGLVRLHQTMAELEKPIVGKVNGNALGFGSSLVLACDLIIADEEALIIDIHLGMGEVKEGGPNFGIVSGDGGSALAPLFFSPAKAKEFLMLAKRYTGRELADMNVINYAVPASELDAKVDEIVQALLRRSSYALAWTKRTCNRRVADHLNMTLDSAAAYEMVNFLQIDRLDGSDPMTLSDH
ncbi:MAG: enoyl-CoA hydratase/isomerase family protein [Gaiellales bacterium]